MVAAIEEDKANDEGECSIKAITPLRCTTWSPSGSYYPPSASYLLPYLNRTRSK